MLVGGVVGDVVEDHLDPARVGLADETIDRVQVAEARLHVAVVGDVEPVIEQRRAVARPDPHGGGAERAGQVVQRLDEPFEVADAVAVGIAKARELVLVEHHLLPPAARLMRHAGPRS